MRIRVARATGATRSTTSSRSRRSRSCASARRSCRTRSTGARTRPSYKAFLLLHGVRLAPGPVQERDASGRELDLQAARTPRARSRATCRRSSRPAAGAGRGGAPPSKFDQQLSGSWNSQVLSAEASGSTREMPWAAEAEETAARRHGVGRGRRQHADAREDAREDGAMRHLDRISSLRAAARGDEPAAGRVRAPTEELELEYEVRARHAPRPAASPPLARADVAEHERALAPPARARARAAPPPPPPVHARGGRDQQRVRAGRCGAQERSARPARGGGEPGRRRAPPPGAGRGVRARARGARARRSPARARARAQKRLAVSA